MAPHNKRWRNVLLFLCSALLLFAASLFCLFQNARLSVPSIPLTQALQEAPHLPDLADRILQTYVTPQGLVRYDALRKQPAPLDHYLAITQHISPQTHPHIFPTTAHRLAFWLNTYNLTVLKNVLRFPRWRDLHAYPRKVRFFYISTFLVGRQRWNLYDLEHDLIRPRFREPRVHFALNCASLGCPRLPAYAFRPERLEQQLDHETKRFLQDPRNLRIDHKQRTITLSALFEWYNDDFVSSLSPNKQPSTSQTILLYIDRYRPRKAALSQIGYTIRFAPYDWRLNSTH